MYRVFITDECSRAYEKSDHREQIWFYHTKEELKLKISGKILHFPWFREKKFEGKRLYFIIDEYSRRILLIAFARKKDQQLIINSVINHIPYWFEHLRGLP